MAEIAAQRRRVATRKASQKVLAVLGRWCPSCWAAVPT
jgi:transketolase